MEKKEQLAVSIRFSKINVLKFSQNDIGNFEIQENTVIEYQSDIQLKVKEDSDEVVILSTIKVVIGEIKETFAELQVECFFGIKPFDRVVKQTDENNYGIPDELMTKLASVVIDTIRGILYEKLKGTPLQNEVFPLTDVSAFCIKEAK